MEKYTEQTQGEQVSPGAPRPIGRAQPARRSSMLARERERRRLRRQRRNMLMVCWLCIALIGIIGLYYATDFLDWARVRNYPLEYREAIDQYAGQYQLDPALVCAVIYSESSFRPDAVSVDGARGMMQIMPSTGEWIASKLGEDDFTVERLFEPELNIRYGCWFLNYLFGRFSGDVDKVLAAYNAGQGNVDSWLEQPECSSDGVTLEHIPVRETRNYVTKVKAVHDVYLERYYSERMEAQAA